MGLSISQHQSLSNSPSSEAMISLSWITTLPLVISRTSSLTSQPQSLSSSLRLVEMTALMDNNVTIAHLKNLVIDKPAPITTKLAQTHGNDFALMDNNVTTAHLKNLVIDKPAPITTKLA